MTNLFRIFRQPVSGLTHFAGLLLSFVGLGNLVNQTGALIFGISMIFLYSASSLYHLAPVSEAWVQRFRRLDHSSIFLFIAGSYTPVCLGPLRNGSGPYLLLAVCFAATIGVGIKFFSFSRSRWLDTGAYLVMGWGAVIVLPEMWRTLPAGAFFWFTAGGLVYTGGALVYASKRPDPIPNIFGFHEIWHLFVMTGSFCHYWMVRAYLLTGQ